MILLVFRYLNEFMRFKIEGKNIYYTDRIWKSLRCIPKDEEFSKAILFSRNKLPKKLVDLFNLSEEDMREYGNCKNEEELANYVIRDCKLKGLQLVNKNASN